MPKHTRKPRNTPIVEHKVVFIGGHLSRAIYLICLAFFRFQNDALDARFLRT
jgi:hypothetical protein